MSETLLLALALVIVIGVVAIIVLLLRPRTPVADPAADQRLAELNARLDAMGSWLQNSHIQLQHTVNSRLDAVSQNLGESMKTTTKKHHRPSPAVACPLAVIDSAQKNITDLASTVTSLQKVFDNKQRRGALRPGPDGGHRPPTGCRKAPMNSSSRCRTSRGRIAASTCRTIAT
ncbi:MAG: hypothetical protein WDN48_09640 [Pseudolabrys sp.]